MKPGTVMTFASLEAATGCLEEIGLPISEADGQVVMSSVSVPDGLSRLDEVLLDAASSDDAKTLAGTLLALAPARATAGRYEFAVSIASQNGEWAGIGTVVVRGAYDGSRTAGGSFTLEGAGRISPAEFIDGVATHMWRGDE